MQKSAFYCDQCKKVIGDKVHITMVLNGGPCSGIAIPPTHIPKGPLTLDVASGQWRVRKVSGFMHFCSSEHLAAYFQKLIDEVDGEKKPRKRA